MASYVRTISLFLYFAKLWTGCGGSDFPAESMMVFSDFINHIASIRTKESIEISTTFYSNFVLQMFTHRHPTHIETTFGNEFGCVFIPTTLFRFAKTTRLQQEIPVPDSKLWLLEEAIFTLFEDFNHHKLSFMHIRALDCRADGSHIQHKAFQTEMIKFLPDSTLTVHSDWQVSVVSSNCILALEKLNVLQAHCP